MGLNPVVDFNQYYEQKAKSSYAVLTTQIHFAAFDKADESLLNDYEELLAMLDGNDNIVEDFKNIVNDILFNDPESITHEIDKTWENTVLEDRLVYQSPIPLNEEQRKIQNAIKNKKSRFITCSGPPGTGKSHTITALAFDAILDGKNILILSDKKEALDVVESKITNCIDSVRWNEEFQNPILRLGKTANTYNKIISNAAMLKIKTQYNASRANIETINETIKSSIETIKNKISSENNAYKKVNLKSIFQLIRSEDGIDDGHIMRIFNDPNNIESIKNIKVFRDILNNDNQKILNILLLVIEKPTLDNLVTLLHICEILKESTLSNDGRMNVLNLFNNFRKGDHDKLLCFIQKYQNIKYPIFNFLFTKSKAREIDNQIGSILDIRSTLDLHRHLYELINAYGLLSEIIQSLKTSYKDDAYINYAFHIISRDVQIDEDLLNNRFIIKSSCLELYKKESGLLKNCGIDVSDLSTWRIDSNNKSDLFDELYQYSQRYYKTKSIFDEIPEVNYASNMSKLYSLNTIILANKIDERVLDFYDKKKATAKTIKSIIKKKQKFPKELFYDLKNAFPCIIANIRDYAEYTPLEPELFDLIIIDEASQVSIAQAFPAILRCKKLVVFGDAKQFSNVKTTNASRMINAQYVNQIKEEFIKNNTIDAAILNRLDLFNIKTSVLSFVEMLSNYSIMLRKHFRGYKEHISYSSRYFYDGQLQAVKIRGIPIYDALEITTLDDDGKISIHRNVNELEGEYIVEKIKELVQLENPPTVAVITPFKDQQKYLTQELQKSANIQEIYDKFKLKIMTFDSCQGEEREYIFYSMVATNTHDRLYGIFPKSFHEAGDPEEKLRLQRLNVGFSRVQEKMHIVTSKTIENFSGAIGHALNHYVGVLENAETLPTSDEVDRNSPMEAKVLDWLENTKFYQKNSNNIEIVPQFPIGEYLSQLDHTYNHPSYRVDFLLKITINQKVYQFIIEYDGFKEHFKNLDEIDPTNYQYYYKESDIEREKILESYGYRILRINRFNVGKDPVITLSERLYRLTKDIFNANQPHELINEIKGVADSINSGDKKICTKCNEAKDKEEFYDESLASGIGRICKSCKGNKKQYNKSDKKQTAKKTSIVDTNVQCPQCSSGMVLRNGRYGKFYGCSNFPRCRGTRQAH